MSNTWGRFSIVSDSKDYYEILGVDRDADARTIKRSFLKKARQVHPDVSDDPDAEEKFKELNEAYSVLSDEQKRANYDRYGTADGPMGGGYVDFSDIFGGVGVDDIFSSFFGGAGGGRGGRQQRRAGRDMAISLSISLEEAASGCKKTISFDRLAPCEDCGGSGAAEGAREVECSRCHGTGYVTTYQRSIFGQVQSSSPCPDCQGEGTVIDHPCDMCDGQGRTPTHEKIDIDIPAGVATGRQLRVRGYGEAGFRGASCGDLIVTIQVTEHARFTRSGDDLLCEAHVSIAQAALGCEIEVDGILEGERVQVSVPAGTQFGNVVTQDGYGMPRSGAGSSKVRGRLLVRVLVDVPTKLNAAQREALERFAEASGDDVAHKKTVGDRIRDVIDDMLD